MKIHSNLEPFHHIIIDDFLDEYSFKNVFDEILRLESILVGPKETKAAVVGGQFVKKGNGVFLDDIYQDRSMSEILKCLTKLFTPIVLEAAKETGFFFKYYYHKTTHDWTLLQSYGDADYYNPHPDECLFTAITLIHKEPKKYEGGILHFPEQNYEIDLKNNQSIIFPARIPHAVSRITKENDDYTTNRFTITKFIHCKTVE